MSRRCYKPKTFRPDSLAIIEQANAICRTYQQQGFDLTLRQLYYQFVSRDLLPNNDRSYDRLGSIVNDARLAGLLDWSYIVDRTRNVRQSYYWDSPAQIIRNAAGGYVTDKWTDQPNRVEVWIEKDALVGVIAGVCGELDVPYFSCRGYTSQSEIWSAGRRMLDYIVSGHRPIVLHLGDHDPSGIDMTRDIDERLKMFTTIDYLHDHMPESSATYGEIWARMRERHGAGPVEVHRIALTMDQIEQYDPPPNPAKLSDARARGYVEEYGSASWELDALEPTVLADLIREHVGRYVEADLWEAQVEREESEREILTATSERWADVVEFLNGEAS